MAAQDMGVRVAVLGLAGGRSNQAATLTREADGHYVLPVDDFRQFFWDQRLATATVQSGLDPAVAAAAAGAAFADDWFVRATKDEATALLAQRPVLPRALDSQMLAAAEATVGAMPAERQDERRALRGGFWDRLAGLIVANSTRASEPDAEELRAGTGLIAEAERGAPFQ